MVSCFGVSKADHTVLESQWVHECIVEAVKQGCAEGLFSKNKRNHLKTLFLLDDATFGVLPTWVSFDLLKEIYHRDWWVYSYRKLMYLEASRYKTTKF